MRGCTKDMVMKTLRSNFIPSNISVHQRREEQGVTLWWIIELLGLTSAAEGLYLSEGRYQTDGVVPYISFYKCSCNFSALSHG